jgi:hypothetical protein
MKVHAQRLIVVISLALAAAAIGAGAALADRPDDRAGMLGVGATSSSVGEQPSHPNDQAGVLGVGGVSSVEVEAVIPVRPDDRGGVRGPGPEAAEMPSVTTFSDDGFQWGDAAFGAGAAFSLVLLTAGAMATIRHRRRVALS